MSTVTVRLPLAVLALLFCGLARSYGYDAAISDAYGSLSLTLPTTNLVIVCHGFGCGRRTPVALTAGDRTKLAQLLAAGRASPEAERRAVAAATAWFDRRVGPAAGTTRRVARAGALTQNDPGQMDCIDTSRNNTSLFLLLDQLQLFRHHKVEGPEARGFFIDGRAPHATAVLREIRSGQKWAIDNWTHNHGEQPDVMPLEQWKNER
jgi:hypothetical protein